MVTGYAIVLWSRLYIIVSDRRIVRGVLCLIIADALIFHTAMWILQFGLAAHKGAQRKPWLRVVNPMERTQIVIFTVQEVLISVFYMRGTYKLLNDRILHHSKQTRNALLLLFAVQTIVIMMVRKPRVQILNRTHPFL